MSNITFPKAKVGDKIRLTGSEWNREGEEFPARGDIVTVSGHDEEGIPYFGNEEGYIFTDGFLDWGGELVEEAEVVNLSFETKVRVITRRIADLLIEKNRKYGNSALDPERIFSGASSTEAIRVRIDDKLSRIKTSDPEDQEDSITDLIGYLILLKIAEGK